MAPIGCVRPGVVVVLLLGLAAVRGAGAPGALERMAQAIVEPWAEWLSSRLPLTWEEHDRAVHGAAKVLSRAVWGVRDGADKARNRAHGRVQTSGGQPRGGQAGENLSGQQGIASGAGTRLEAQDWSRGGRELRDGGRRLSLSSPSPPPITSLACSGVGRLATGNASFDVCNGQRVTPETAAAAEALRAAAASGAADGVVNALTAGLLSVPGLNVSALIAPTTPIPPGVNLSALPSATQDALMSAANVSSLSNLTTIGQLLTPEGTLAPGLSPADLAALLPANATRQIAEGIDCGVGFEERTVCACPLDFRGAQCESRRSLTLSLRVLDRGLRDCLEHPPSASLSPESSLPSPSVLGFGGSDTSAVGLPSCLFFSSSSTPAPPNAPRDVTIRLAASLQFHPSDRPRAFFCNATALTPAAVDSLLAREGLSRATARGPPPFFGLPCAEDGFEYALGPSLDLAASASPLVSLSARVWSFDRLSDSSASDWTSLGAESPPLPWDEGVRGAAEEGASGPGLVTVRQDRSTSPPTVTISVRASELPERFAPAGRAHLEVVAAQVVAGDEVAYPSVIVVDPSEASAANMSRYTPCCGGDLLARLNSTPPLPVRRPWPLLELALDDADWVPPPMPVDAAATTAAVVSTVVLATLVALVMLWWTGRCGAVEEALGLEGFWARAGDGSGGSEPPKVRRSELWGVRGSEEEMSAGERLAGAADDEDEDGVLGRRRSRHGRLRSLLGRTRQGVQPAEVEMPVFNPLAGSEDDAKAAAATT